MAEWDDYLQNQENVDGVRFSWNLLPHCKSEASKLVVPPGVFFTPLKGFMFSTFPLFSAVDYRAKSWSCAICHNRNAFPPHYAAISEQNQPPDLALTTIEYTLRKFPNFPPVFYFVVDTCIPANELTALKEAIQKEISILPPEAFVGIITFGRNIELKELDGKNLGKSYVFSGGKEIDEKKIRDLLTANGRANGPVTTKAVGLPPGAAMPAASPGFPPQPIPPNATGAPLNGFQPGVPGHPPVAPGPPISAFPGPPVGPRNSLPAQSAAPGAFNKFLQPISECEQVINDLVEQIRPDQWDVPQGNRALRATGSALAAAVTVLEACFPNSGARIMTFIGGACTSGPGLVVNEELKNPIRSWHDIKEDAAVHIRKAKKFYDTLAARAVKNGHTIDIFCCALDQTGLHEMNALYHLTNGHVVMADSFESTLFKQSFSKVFEKDEKGQLKMAFNATTEIKLSAGLRVEGVLGSCTGLGVKNPSVSDVEVGVGGTCQWKFCSLTPRNTLAFLLEITPTSTAIPQGARAVVQFVTQYQHSDGSKRIRVTTTGRNWIDATQQRAQLAFGFDQDAAAVLMARLAAYRAANEQDSPEAMRWIDRSLIRLIQRFSEFQAGDPNSLKINDRFQAFPQFMFHLRRSQFLQVFNNSPDETAYYRHTLFGENVTESTVMIQPMLYSYSFNGPPEPVLLDTTSIQPDKILLMDDYFHVLIYHGQTIDQWKKAKYHEDPNYLTFRQLLDAPVEDASQLIAERFPVPRYIVTQYEGSQARFLLSKVNPSLTHNNTYQQTDGAAVLTDDVSFQVFTEHLRKLVTQGSS